MHAADSVPFPISPAVTADGTGLSLSFPVTGYRACQVQSRVSLNEGDWTVVTNIPAATASRTLQYTNALGGASACYFRVRQTP
jgi:hypothetical protein